MSNERFDSTTQPALLSYQRRGRWVLSRRVTWFAILGVVIYVAGTALRANLPERLIRKYWVHRFANHVVPPNQLVYEQHNLLSTPWDPESLRSLPRADRSSTRRFADPPKPVTELVAPQFSDHGVALFLGKLKAAAGGGERNVLLVLPFHASPLPSPQDVSRAQDSYCDYLGTQELVTSGSFAADAIASFVLFDDRRGLQYPMFERTAQVYRFYGGQRDPADPAHFTVDFDADDQRIRMHCRLIDLSHLRIHFERRGS